MNNHMAMFMAQKLMSGVFDYAAIFSVSLYKRYQEDVDAILIAEGKEDLIAK